MAAPAFYGEVAYRRRLGKRLRSVRERRGVSQAQVSRGICTPAFLSMVEQGQSWPSLNKFIGIARRLKVNPAKLLH